jgi:hypothetical protein
MAITPTPTPTSRKLAEGRSRRAASSGFWRRAPIMAGMALWPLRPWASNSMGSVCCQPGARLPCLAASTSWRAWRSVLRSWASRTSLAPGASSGTSPGAATTTSPSRRTSPSATRTSRMPSTREGSSPERPPMLPSSCGSANWSSSPASRAVVRVANAHTDWLRSSRTRRASWLGSTRGPSCPAFAVRRRRQYAAPMPGRQAAVHPWIGRMGHLPQVTHAGRAHGAAART